VTMKMKAQDVQNAPAERGVTLVGKRIAGIPLVDSVLCRKATELAQECYQPYLFNHAMRTYLFGALVGRSEKMDFDMEFSTSHAYFTISGVPAASWAKGHSRSRGPGQRKNFSSARDYRK